MTRLDQLMHDLYNQYRMTCLSEKDITILMHPEFRHELLCDCGFQYMSMADEIYHKDTIQGVRIIVTQQVDQYQFLRICTPPSLHLSHEIDAMSYVCESKSQIDATTPEPIDLTNISINDITF